MSETSASLNPAQAMQRAARLQAQGQPAQAEQIYRSILAEHPEHHAAYHSLGLLACHVGNNKLAIDLLAQAIKLDAKIALYHSNLCELLRREGRLFEAVTAGNKAVAIAPDDADARYNLGLAYADSGDWAAAIKHYERLLEMTPQHGLAWNNLGAALEALDRTAAALAAYRRAVAINPQHAEAQNNLGVLLSAYGRPSEARQCFAAALATRPDFAEAHYNQSSLKTWQSDDPQLQTLRSIAADDSQPLETRIRMNFALGKALEDIGDYEQSFAAYQTGNSLKFASSPYRESSAETVFEQVRTLFNPDFFAARKPSAIVDQTPVFIVGMPRSGTTLIEQILSSHRYVYGAGELTTLHETIRGSLDQYQVGSLFERLDEALPQLDYLQMGKTYLQQVRKLDEHALRITDKMPANFFFIGFIRLMLPGAKIIHVRRDPLDTCLSCYTRLFNNTMDFTYDLKALGNYYSRYARLMQHWQEVLPAGTIFTISYEGLVKDPRRHVQQLLEYVGLPWDDACLEFYRNPRQVKTASVNQVRQPLYQSSIGRWQRYAVQLEPLRQILSSGSV